MLLPVWASAYRYRGKRYQFIVNGQTGEVQGERPWSWLRIGLAVAAGLIVAGAIIWAVRGEQLGFFQERQGGEVEARLSSPRTIRMPLFRGTLGVSLHMFSPILANSYPFEPNKLISLSLLPTNL